mgnify:CR=1 FL=1
MSHPCAALLAKLVAIARKMWLLVLASLLPAAVAAAFDKCARPNGEWAGFDQVALH